MSERDAIVAWQPIETAPRDGTWILIWKATEWGPSHYVAQWGKPQWEGVQEMSWVTIALGPNPDTYEADDATHWMPLPPPPSDHLPASVAGECAGCEGSPSIENNPCAVCGQAHRAIHAAEVERLREALEAIALGVEAGRYVGLRSARQIARQTLEASR